MRERRPDPDNRIAATFILFGLVMLTIFLWAAILGIGYLIIELIWGWS
jgi:hypothetical protein